MDSITVRGVRPEDWSAIARLADAAVGHLTDSPTQAEWAERRQSFSGIRRHHVVTRNGRTAGYGALERAPGEPPHAFRAFIVTAWNSEEGVPDEVWSALERDLRALEVTDVWMREYASDAPLLEFVTARGFSITDRFEHAGEEMVVLAQHRSHRPDIRRSRHFPDDDQRALGVTTGDAFGIGHLSLEWRRKDIHFTWFEESRPIAHVGLLDRISVDVGGSREHVVGLGSVVTRADRRGQGYAARLIDHALEATIAESPCSFAMLFCLPALRGYYQGLGWEEISGVVDVLQTGGAVQSPLVAMMRQLRGDEWPAGAVIAHERFW